MNELKEHLFVPYSELQAGDELGDAFTLAKSYYLKDEADATIAELKDKCQMHDFFWDGCGFAKRGFKNTIAVSEAFDTLEMENRRLTFNLWSARLEAAQAKADEPRIARCRYMLSKCKEHK